MNNIVEQILRKWIEVSGYDPEQTKFNLLSSNYEFHRCGERIEQLLKFDGSGVFAALYAKASFETICKGLTCKLIDILKNPDGTKEYQDMWDMFNCPEMVEVENNAIHNIIRLTNIKPAIGEADKEHELDQFRDSVEYIAEEFTKCKMECFSMQPGTKIADDLKFMTTLQIFNTTTECVLSIERSPDGIYLCYITDFNSAGGYFGYFIKSGFNILSFNDRINESFVGEHTRSRNNRFIEQKKWHIFPYDELVTPEGRDYLGYSKSLVCEVKPRDIREFKSNNTYPIMLSAVLIMKRYSGCMIDEIVDGKEVEQVYIDSLLKQNVSSEEVSALVPVTGNSLIIAANTHIPMYNFTTDNVISNELQSRYHFRTEENKGKRHTGTYTDVNKILIDIYGDGFELKPLEVMHRQWPQLTDGSSGSSDTVVSEFIGPKEQMEMEFYRQSRRQLRDHILHGMSKAYEEAGGYEGVHRWYRQKLLDNIDALRWMAVDWYIDYLDGNTRSCGLDPWSITTSKDLEVHLATGEQGHWAPRLDHDYVMNAGKPGSKRYHDTRYDLYECPITGNTANMWFVFVPNTWQNIEKLAGTEVPKILKGFAYSGSDYGGNPLINSCDPIAFIENPFQCRITQRESYLKLFPKYDDINFNCAVGFSKRGLNQLVKERRANR